MFVRPKGVCTVCTQLCTGALSACILIPSSWFCLRAFMQVSAAGDMTLRPGPAVTGDVLGSVGPPPEVSVAGVRSVDRVQVCGDRTFFVAIRGVSGRTEGGDFNAVDLDWHNLTCDGSGFESCGLHKLARRIGIR